MSLATLFDYDTLDIETRIVVQQKTGEIRERVKRTTQDLIEIGERLIDVKDRLGHGRFGTWLAEEFDFSDDTAENLMNAAIKFRNFRNLSMAPSALYLLSRPSIPAPAFEEAVEKASNGNHLTHSAAKQIVGKHKADRLNPPAAKPVPGHADWFAADDEREQAETGSRDPDPEPAEEPAPVPTPDNRVPIPGQGQLFSMPVAQPKVSGKDPVVIHAGNPIGFPPRPGERREYEPFEKAFQDTLQIFGWVKNLGGIEGATQGWEEDERANMAIKLELLNREYFSLIPQWVAFLRRPV